MTFVIWLIVGGWVIFVTTLWVAFTLLYWAVVAVAAIIRGLR